MAFPSIFLILIVAVVAVLVVSRRGPHPVSLRPITPAYLRRKRLFRRACGGLGGLILIASLVSTWWNSQSTYREVDPPESFSVLEPTKIFAEIAESHPLWQRDQTDVQNARLLVQMVGVDLAVMTPRVVWADSEVIDWPEQEAVERTVDFRGQERQLRIEIENINIRSFDDDPPNLHIYGDIQLKSRSTSSSSGGYLSEAYPRVASPGGRFGASPPTTTMPSIVPLADRNEYPRLLVRAHLVSPDDPLMKVPATALLDSCPDLKEAKGYWGILTPLKPYREWGLPPAFDLISRMGIGFVAILAAGLLLARLWRRYLIGVGIMLPAMLALVVIADSANLSSHAARLENESLPTPHRMLAAIRTGQTFFYGESAVQQLSEVAKDPTADRPLARLASKLALVINVAMNPSPFRTPGGSSSGSVGGPTVNGRSLSGCYDVVLQDSRGDALLLCVYRLEQGYSIGNEPTRIILSQVPALRRIVIVSEAYSVRVIGTERDFVEAIASRERPFEDDNGVWRRLILPALYPEEYEGVDEP